MTPLILLTNDDGFDAPGLQSLAEALKAVGEVAIAAPDKEQSACGAGLTLGNLLRAVPRGPKAWAVSGHPVDCIYLAVNGLLDRKPDLVISGINRGANLACDVHYSGTVAGAMEGCSNGIPSMAVSLAKLHGPFDYRESARMAVKLAREILEKGLPDRVFLNVNVPPVEDVGEGYRLTKLGLREYGRSIVAQTDPRGKPFYWIGGHLETYKVAGSDCEAIEEGVVSVTPITLDWTASTVLAEWQKKGSL